MNMQTELVYTEPMVTSAPVSGLMRAPAAGGRAERTRNGRWSSTRLRFSGQALQIQ